MKIAKQNSRSHEDLCLLTVGTVLGARVIRLDLRPEFLGHVILESIVPGEGSADLGLVTGRKSRSKRSLNIKSTEAFPIGDRRSDDRLRGPVLIPARGECRLEERRKNIVPVLFLSRDDTVFQKEAPVPKPVLQSRITVHDIGGRCDEKDLDMSLRDQFEALAAIVIFCGNPVVAALPENVVPVYLQKAGRRSRHRRDPMRLLRLGPGSHLEPIFKEAATLWNLSSLTGGNAILSMNERSGAKIDRKHEQASQTCIQGPLLDASKPPLSVGC